MTKIPSVEERVEEFNKVFPLPRVLALSGGMGVQRDMMNDWLTQALTADRTALILEIRKVLASEGVLSMSVEKALAEINPTK